MPNKIKKTEFEMVWRRATVGIENIVGDQIMIDFILKELQQQKEETIKIIKEVAERKFPIGKRKWCIECAKRIKSDILKQL